MRDSEREHAGAWRRALRYAAALAALLPAAAAFADGDAARGAQVFRACAACHAVAPGANYSGPSLAGVWGRKAGTLAGFGRYSDALRRSGLAWNRTTLDLWLRDPAALVPGNAMTFAGIGDAVARADVIAYLRALSRGEAVAKPEERQPNPDLKTAPPAARIAALRYCRGSHAYFVTDGTGRVTPYWEFNLRFKSDSSDRGPRPGAPVLVGAGMQGDKAQAVFADPREISTFIRYGC